MGLINDLTHTLGFDKIKESDMVFVVLGRTGVGKSTFINRFAGKDIQEVGKKLETTTKKISYVVCPGSGKQRVVLVDTPTFPLSKQEETKFKDWMKKSLGHKFNFYGIIYLCSIQENRSGGAESPSAIFKRFVQTVGMKFDARIVLVTTKWEGMKETEIGENRESNIKNGEWSELIKKGSLVLRHTGTSESARDVIEKVISTGQVSALGH